MNIYNKLTPTLTPYACGHLFGVRWKHCLCSS